MHHPSSPKASGGGGHNNRRGKNQGNARTARDPRLSKAPAFTMGGRYKSELDRLSSITPFYPQGTHRAEHGQTLLANGRLFDTKTQDHLKKVGRQWKATPGPGAYKTQRCLLDHDIKDNADGTRTRYMREPAYKFTTGPQSQYMELQLGDRWRNPGPGTYRTYTVSTF